jgi:rSAM/selenodomain-associated transferase 1
MARRQGRKRGASYAPRLIIMAKSPVLGLAKRRLAREIGGTRAIRFYRVCLSHTLLRLASDRRWQTTLGVTPDKDAAQRLWPSRRAPRLRQGNGDLGARMQRLFNRLPPGPAIVVGSDIPAISPLHIAQAFRLLRRADAVLGPAPDGGYWLVGLKRTPKILAPFASVRWSGQHALADTVGNLKGKGIVYAATLCDVDTADNFRSERVRAERLIPPRS